ncbi:uroporphyrinogen-III C-methyltransferase [Tropicibacter naphthalenivorans]|uniref:uroporphyrinogen-III C-methyltransferase n=1 Tax=Tropicibacter naphthalenivorans TaxID=441103 RepID=A0A0P1G1F5_9RHOB|nr:uroporphyrinogen-III C-methyltransferase [Tropicibacter naphthalenivorans]CUH75616.1 Siroheme synthase [Tropicibacter naphthalenivorans]SMC43192.1 uroporphyrin-III C-methyltransferase / precorrin-2 dehydrogenase / sirohydrochlorin ferrochelatase [Tropicibacter naphthalenivorans]
MALFPTLSLFSAGDGPVRRKAMDLLRRIVEGKATPVQGGMGTIALVGTGPGAADLLTVRAVDRIRTAEVIFYDRLVDPEVLEYADARAEKVYVGKEVGAHAWPQERINAAIVAEALRGRRVVRLKSGDPGVFGRAGEELTAAAEHAIPVEMVPGVTAACAAASAMGQSLTERGVSDTLILTTAMGRAGDPLPDCARMSAPGTTTAFYMGVRQAGRIAQALQGRGLPQDAPITVAVEVSKPGQRVFRTDLGDMPDLIAREGITGCAILMVTWPEARVALTETPVAAMV